MGANKEGVGGAFDSCREVKGSCACGAPSALEESSATAALRSCFRQKGAGGGSCADLLQILTASSRLGIPLGMPIRGS